MDIFSNHKRSEIMAKISGKNTKPEIAVRSLLHREGFRFRVHKVNLPGKPDIFLPKYKTAIFVHGCYWHRHSCKKGCSFPSTNQSFWRDKFLLTQERDRRNVADLEKLGFKVLVVWECELKDSSKLSSRLRAKILKKVN